MATNTNAPSLSNMYRVGDYVYFEVHAGYPYQIRRIEELNRANSGSQVEVKVQCYYRRRDIPSALIHLADPSFNDKHPSKAVLDSLSLEDRHSLNHRELFLSRQSEKVPAQYIRGKCTVNLISEVESPDMYINKEDAFFYSLVYDPVNKTLLKDQGEMRVGFRYQAPVDSVKPEIPLKVDCDDSATLMWDPSNCVSEEEWAKYMIIVRSIGTFSRALHHTTQVRDTNLVNAAACASRDVAVGYGHNLLNKCKYNFGSACMELVPENGPLLIQDQSEEWSASEASLFEEALEKYGKDFGEIRKHVLPWKPMPAIIEYYYMWKTTDRYMRQKRIKATEAENKLKQVYIPSSGAYNNPNKIPTNPNNGELLNVKCEGCNCTESTAWFLWGPNNMCKLCESCWVYWKKFGGLKKPSAFEKVSGGASVREFKKLVNRMADQSEFKCVVEGCDKEFRVRNQLYRHLASVHNLCMTAKTSYAQIIIAREPFLMMATEKTKKARNCQKNKFMKMGRNPCIEIDTSNLVTDENANGNSDSSLEKDKRKKCSIEDLAVKIAEFNKEVSNGRKRGLIERANGTTAPYKKLHLESPSQSWSIKQFSWIDSPDGYTFKSTPETKEKRLKLTSLNYRQAARCATFKIAEL